MRLVGRCHVIWHVPPLIPYSGGELVSMRREPHVTNRNIAVQDTSGLVVGIFTEFESRQNLTTIYCPQAAVSISYQHYPGLTTVWAESRPHEHDPLPLALKYCLIPAVMATRLT